MRFTGDVSVLSWYPPQLPTKPMPLTAHSSALSENVWIRTGGSRR
jgi:hypothetical protein